MIGEAGTIELSLHANMEHIDNCLHVPENDPEIDRAVDGEVPIVETPLIFYALESNCNHGDISTNGLQFTSGPSGPTCSPDQQPVFCQLGFFSHRMPFATSFPLKTVVR